VLNRMLLLSGTSPTRGDSWGAGASQAALPNLPGSSDISGLLFGSNALFLLSRHRASASSHPHSKDEHSGNLTWAY